MLRHPTAGLRIAEVMAVCVVSNYCCMSLGSWSCSTILHEPVLYVEIFFSDAILIVMCIEHRSVAWTTFNFGYIL
jgi:hypothetical protein